LPSLHIHHKDYQTSHRYLVVVMAVVVVVPAMIRLVVMVLLD
jgi:hypothetical protein